MLFFFLFKEKNKNSQVLLGNSGSWKKKLIRLQILLVKPISRLALPTFRDHPKIFFQGRSNPSGGQISKFFIKVGHLSYIFGIFFTLRGVKTPPDPPWDDPCRPAKKIGQSHINSCIKIVIYMVRLLNLTKNQKTQLQSLE